MNASEIIASSPAPPLTDPLYQRAELLIMLIHRGFNSSVWSSRSASYWSALESRVKSATYAGPRLLDWWSTIMETMSAEVLRETDRLDIVTTLGGLSTEEEKRVVMILRANANALVLRIRVHVEAGRRSRHEG